MERAEKKSLASNWFQKLRNEICASFEALERKMGSAATFERTNWKREEGGGGEMSLMKGEIFEKVGVNISTVKGKFSEAFAKEIPGTNLDSSFWASGISVVAHMKSPLVPAVHMNTRMIQTEKTWFGGGMDLTPTFPYSEDTEHFHAILKESCDLFSPSYYPDYKKWCDEYFYLPHRGEARGVGGIFYDYLDSGSWEEDFKFTQAIGKAFLSAFIPIVERRMTIPYSQEEKEKQLIKRGRYVEFNLLYDRGTRFGLMTNGKVEAILMSLPPEVKWI